MKKYFLGILCVLFVILSGCGPNPDVILQNDSVSVQTEEIVTEPSSETAEENEEQIFVYICGAVENPGVYAMDEGSRVFQLVDLAGGFRADADLQSVNQAEQVADGQMIRILTQEESAAGETSGTDTAGAAAVSDEGKVNINRADREQLTTLNGIGDTKAAAIIQYRESHGSFQSIDEIMQVDGIAQGTYDKIKDDIVIK